MTNNERSTGPTRLPEEFPNCFLNSEKVIGPLETVASWQDLLGFSALLEKINWDLTSSDADVIISRLIHLGIQLEQRGGAGQEQLIINDGVVNTFSPYVYNSQIGSRYDILQWLHSRLTMHCITTGIEKDYQLPGTRTIICSGQMIIYKSERFHERTINDIRASSSRDYFPLSTQLNTAFSKCYLADQAGSKAGLKRGSIYIEKKIISKLIKDFKCEMYENSFLFFHGSPLLAPVTKYIQVNNYFQIDGSEYNKYGIDFDRSSWIKLGDEICIEHKNLKIDLIEIEAYSPYDESALFWFDTLTGDMHGFNDNGAILLDDNGNPRRKNPELTSSEKSILIEHSKALEEFVEKNGKPPQMVLKEDNIDEVVNMNNDHAEYININDIGMHPWKTTILGGEKLKKAISDGDIVIKKC